MQTCRREVPSESIIQQISAVNNFLHVCLLPLNFTRVLTSDMVGRGLVLQQLILLTIVLPYQSLLSSCRSYCIQSSIDRASSKYSILYAKRNPFSTSDNHFCGDSAEKIKLLPSNSALFSSSASRGKIRNAKSSDGIPFDNVNRGNVIDILTISLVGCLLSIIITRDIWCAASSFLALNVLASQRNSFGSFMSGLGGKLVAISRGLTRKKMMTNVFDFFKAVNEASVLHEPQSNLESRKKSVDHIKHQRNYTPFENVDSSNDDSDDTITPMESVSADEMKTARNIRDSHIKKAVRGTSARQVIGIPRTIFVEDDELTISPSKVPCSSVPLISGVIYTDTETPIGPEIQTDYTSMDRDIPAHVPIQPASVSDDLVLATIEVQAAADAASARLKAWLIQQKAVEEEKRKLKLSIIMEKNRICDLPRQRLELLRHLAIFVSTIDCTDLAVTTFEDVIASEKYLQLGSFSSRAVECSTGSISDFVTVLTSPGKNTLKQRYRLLAKEFHPDSARNVDLSSHTVDSLMSNLTGAFNYLSGVNSLSTDGHTLMSVKSPWGVKYTGSTDFDPAFAQKDIGEASKVREEDSISSTEDAQKLKETSGNKASENVINTPSDLESIESQVEVVVDFSTPYNSPEQEKKWRGWGKDIDWGKMKFEGGSDIYTRAQESGKGGVGGREKDSEKEKERILQDSVALTDSNKLVNDKKQKSKDRVQGIVYGKELTDQRITGDTTAEDPTSTSSTLQHRYEEDAYSSVERVRSMRSDAQKKVSIKAAYAIAAGCMDEDNGLSSIEAAEAITDVSNEYQKREKLMYQDAVTAVMFVKEFSNIDNEIDTDGVAKGSEEDDDFAGFFPSPKCKAPIRSPIAAQVLIPPMLTGGYYLWGGEIPPSTVPAAPTGQNERKDKSGSSFINCFKPDVPTVPLKMGEESTARELGVQHRTSTSTCTDRSQLKSRTRSLVDTVSSAVPPLRHAASAVSTPTKEDIQIHGDIRSTLDGVHSTLLDLGSSSPSPFTMSSASTIEWVSPVITAARRKAEGRDCVQWVEGVMLKAKGSEIKERVEKSNKHRSLPQTGQFYMSEATSVSAYAGISARGDRNQNSLSSFSPSISFNADDSLTSSTSSSRSFYMD